MESLRARGLALPLFSQDAHREGCECRHCLYFFCIGSWYPGYPGLWTGGQALHAAPVFTWNKKLSQKGVGKQAPPPPYHTSKADIKTAHLRPRVHEYWACLQFGAGSLTCLYLQHNAFPVLAPANMTGLV